ncbi:uncharacterized protein LOC110454324 [Mizuhopecten yessoensis]|uniref:uncharacterized protein LOC110454324 n=1 Tax=Mizuhopecten yessoensis TaxID=6573 RepID=UPI000B458EE9|nr:uncharacterized protein LOC110454324 [Mizuhopecten yessoensis]
MDSSEDLHNSLQDTMDIKLQATILDQLGRINRRTIVMLDNVDDIINKNEKEFLLFVQKLLKELQKKCKVRVIITSRVNLQCDTSGPTISDLRELMRPVKVQQLETHHAKELIRKCTPKGLVSDDECDSLVILTDGNPLALRTICSILKNCFRQVKPTEVIAHLRSDAEKLSMVGMEKCLRESFDRLEESMKNILMQLTLFKTSSFDLQAANAVIKGNNAPKSQDQMTKMEDNAPKSQDLMTKMNVFRLKSCHLIEVQDLTIQTEGDVVQNRKPRPPELGDSNRSVLYSLHPLVFEFLSKQKSQFSDVMRSARIRFFEYMVRIITIIGKEQENSFYNAESHLREYNVHINSFFEVISEIRRDSDIKAGTFNLDTLNRISEIGRRTLSQKGQLAWLRWVTERAERNNDIEMWFDFHGYYIQLLIEMDDTTGIPAIISKTEKKLADVMSRPRRSHQASMKKALGNYYYRKALYFKKVEIRQKVWDNLEKAREYLEDCGSLEPRHTMILANVYNDFGCYYYQHDNEKCRLFHEKAIEKASHRRPPGVGDDHPDVDLFRNNRAVCLLKDVIDRTLDQSSCDRYINEALEHFSNTIATGRMRGTDNTESHASALRNRSVLYLQLKKYEEARSDAKRCLEVQKKIVCEPHVDLTLSYNNVARILYNWGDQMMRDHDTDQGMRLLKESVNYYNQTMLKIKNGGMATSHAEYADIKKFHVKAVDRTDKDRKQLLQQEYLQLECQMSSADYSDDGISLNSDEEISSGDALSTDPQTSSSEDEQTDTFQDAQTETLKEIPVDAQKTVDNTPNFTAPAPKAKGRYVHQDSGYGSSVSSIRSSTSRHLSRQESFEILDRPRMTSNTSGSSEDVFSKPSSDASYIEMKVDLSEDLTRPRMPSHSSGSLVSRRKRLSRDVSLEELMEEILPKKKKRHPKVEGRSHSQQEVENKGDNRKKRLSRGYSDSATPQTTEGSDWIVPVEQGQVITGQNEPITSAHVLTKEKSQGDTVDSFKPVQLTGKTKGQGGTENPVIPVKVTEEEKSQEDTEEIG